MAKPPRVDRVSLEDPKQTSSFAAKNPDVAQTCTAAPPGVGHQLFCAVPPNSSPRVKGGKPAASGAPSPFGLLAGWGWGSNSIILSVLLGGHLVSRRRQPLVFNGGLISSPPAG